MPGDGGGRGISYPGLDTQTPPRSRTVTASIPRPGTNVVAECRGCGEITDLIQGSDWCWTCVYTDPPYIDYAGRPTLAGEHPGGPSRAR